MEGAVGLRRSGFQESAKQWQRTRVEVAATAQRRGGVCCLSMSCLLLMNVSPSLRLTMVETYQKRTTVSKDRRLSPVPYAPSLLSFPMSSCPTTTSVSDGLRQSGPAAQVEIPTVSHSPPPHQGGAYFTRVTHLPTDFQVPSHLSLLSLRQHAMNKAASNAARAECGSVTLTFEQKARFSQESFCDPREKRTLFRT